MNERHIEGRYYIVRNSDRDSASLVKRTENIQRVIETYYGSREWTMTMCLYHYNRNIKKGDQ